MGPVMSNRVILEETTESLFLSEAHLVTADKIMQQDVVSIENTASVFSAVTLIVEKQISGLPVTRTDGRLVGIITESDIFSMVVLHEWSEEYAADREKD